MPFPPLSDRTLAPVKVLFLTSAYPSGRDDPRGIFVHRLARGLVQAGVQVAVVTPGRRGGSGRFEMDGVEVCQASYWIPRWQTLAEGIEGIGPRVRERPWRGLLVPPMLFGMGVSGVRAAVGCDVVHAHWIYPSGIIGVAAARRAGAPLAVTARGGDVNLAQRSRVLRRISRWVLERSDAAIGVSDAIAEALPCFGVEAGRTHQISSGLEIPLPPRRPEGAVDPELKRFRSAPSPRLLFVGGLSPRKSVGTLIEAHRILASRGLYPSTVVIGGGTEEAALRNAAEGMEHVRFPGAIPPEEVLPWMRASDLLILPSRSEGRPNVVAEAMAAGTMVVASNIAGTRELVAEGRTGFLFPPGDAEGLADAVHRALATPPQARKDLLLEARARLDQLGLAMETVVRRHVELYRTLMTGPPKGAVPT